MPWLSGTTSSVFDNTTNAIDYFPIWAAQTQAVNTQNIWIQWTTQTTSTIYNGGSIYQGSLSQPSEQRVKTATELEAEARQLEVYRQRLAHERRVKEEAHARAEGLLLSMLSAEQQEDYRKHKHILHVCKKTHRRYIIQCDRGLSGNVLLVDKTGKALQRLCAHDYDSSLPTPDRHLTQLLHLRYAEEEFLRVANRHAMN